MNESGIARFADSKEGRVDKKYVYLHLWAHTW